MRVVGGVRRYGVGRRGWSGWGRWGKEGYEVFVFCCEIIELKVFVVVEGEGEGSCCGRVCDKCGCGGRDCGCEF